VGRTDSGLFLLMGFGITTVETPVSTTGKFIAYD
jgi:hypothetical protein